MLASNPVRILGVLLASCCAAVALFTSLKNAGGFPCLASCALLPSPPGNGFLEAVAINPVLVLGDLLARLVAVPLFSSRKEARG